MRKSAGYFSSVMIFMAMLVLASNARADVG
jgi:hypothetical protein